MPLGNLKTSTILGEKVIDGDDLNREYYSQNQQHSDKKPTPQLQPHTQPKQITVEKPKAKAKTKTKADEAVLKANAADIKKKNLK